MLYQHRTVVEQSKGEGRRTIANLVSGSVCIPQDLYHLWVVDAAVVEAW